MSNRYIYVYTTPGADRPGFLSIFEREGEIIVSMREIGGTAIDLKLPYDELRKLCGHLTAEYKKPSGNPIIGS